MLLAKGRVAIIKEPSILDEINSERMIGRSAGVGGRDEVTKYLTWLLPPHTHTRTRTHPARDEIQFGTHILLASSKSPSHQSWPSAAPTTKTWRPT